MKQGLKLKPKKCEFFKTRISFLGHIVSRDGIECDPKKIEAIRNGKDQQQYMTLDPF